MIKQTLLLPPLSQNRHNIPKADDLSDIGYNCATSHTRRGGALTFPLAIPALPTISPTTAKMYFIVLEAEVNW